MPDPMDNSLVPASSIFLGLAILAVGLRVVIRRYTGSRLGRDDWLIIVALIFATGLCLTNIIAVPVSQSQTGNQSNTTSLAKLSYARQLFYVFAAAFFKLSALHFYARIWRTSTFLRLKLLFVCLVSCWLVTFFWATVFQAWPINCLWDGCMPSSVYYPALYLSMTAADIALNLAILALPLAMLRRLQLRACHKGAAALMLGLGSFCVAASVMRLVYTVQLAHIMQLPYGIFKMGLDQHPLVKLDMWSAIEVCAGTVCTCLPCYGPALARMPGLGRLGGFDDRGPMGIRQAELDVRYTGGSRERTRAKRLERSGLRINTEGINGILASKNDDGDGCPSDSSSLEQILSMSSLPSPLIQPRVRGDPTCRELYESEVEKGKIHLKTASDQGSGHSER